MIRPSATSTTHLLGEEFTFAADFLVEHGEQCFLLAKYAKGTRSADNELPADDVSAELERIGGELMVKAVEFEAARQKLTRDPNIVQIASRIVT
jgi:hypothetical protein